MAENSRECFEHLLRSLRESRMSWLAEEIEHEIAAGRVVEKEWREVGSRRSESGLAVEDYSESQKLRVALEILMERVQVAHALWEESTRQIKDRLSVREVSFLDADTGQRFQPFTQDFDQALAAFEEMLRRVAKECDLHGPEIDRLSRRPAISLGGER